MSDPDLMLHLALDEVHDDKLFDDTDARRNAVNHGAAIVEDDGFGRCLDFLGSPDSYVELPALSSVHGPARAMTILFWSKLTALDRMMCLLDLEYSGKGRLALFLQYGSNGEFLFSTSWSRPDGGTKTDYRFTDPRMKSVASTWFHLAIVIDQQGGEAYYLDGHPINDFQLTAIGAAWAAAAGQEGVGNAAPAQSCLGKLGAINADSTWVFKGRLAQFRVYSRALAPEEINWDMESDRPVQYRYRITHPIDFSLENRDADPTLFMDGYPDGQTMTLRINNVTSGEVHLSPLPDATPSETNCHFELAFRPGTLEVGSIGKVTFATPNSSWKIAGKTWTGPDDRDSLYLLCAQPGLLPASGLVLELGHMLPDSRYGTRTTLVDFRYKNLKSGAGETISGSVQQNLDLVNHLGRRNIPLHVGFAGSNLVLNNSDRPTTLRLRVTNVLPRTDLYDDPLKAAATGVLRFNEKSEFIISLDERPGTDWALNTPDKIGGIVVRYDKGQVTDNSPRATRFGGTESKPWQWAIPLRGFSLNPEEHLEIRLENVTASGSYGHSNLYLDYRNAPGYWDGRFTCVIDKTSIIHCNGKVGVGVQPEVELDIKGTLRVDSMIVRNRTPTEPRLIKLAEGWNSIFPPRYFRDAQGMVHLFGVCNCILPNDSQKKWAILFGDTSIFTLPNDFAPDIMKFGPFLVPARVRFSSDLQLPSWHTLKLSLRPDGSCQCNIDDPLLKEQIDATKYVSVYLDGISYMARS